MAQGQLRAASAAVTLLVLGVVAELANHASSFPLAAADYTVGAGFVASGVWLVSARIGTGWVGLLAAASWYLATPAAASTTLPAYLDDVASLAWRGPVVHLVVRICTGRRRPWRAYVLIVAGYLAVLVPTPSVGLATALVMAAVAGTAVTMASHAAADTRPVLLATVVASVVLSSVWLTAALDLADGAELTVVQDAALLGVAAVMLASAARDRWSNTAIGGLAVELGPSAGATTPVSTVLSETLADPGLEVRYFESQLGWFDESGSPTPAPPPPRQSAEHVHVTYAPVPGGGQVALIHTRPPNAGAALTRAAAAAAGLAIDSARTAAEVRRLSAEVSLSRRRLLTAADAERKALEARLRAGPAGRLTRIDHTLAGHDDPPVEPIRSQLAAALDDLARLARGLYPSALTDRPVQDMLTELAESTPLPVDIICRTQEELSVEHSALLYFFCAECLTNITRHAGARCVTIRVTRSRDVLCLAVVDDGRGGASLAGARGLQGLADRVDTVGGRLTIDSPPGGPTLIQADIPL